MLLLGYFSRRGVPSGKGSQKGVNILKHYHHFLEPFSSQSEHRDPSKKTWNFRLSPKRPKSGTWAPRVPKRCPKGSILEVFLVPFQGPVPKVKTVLSLESQPHLEGSRVPENHQFSMFFQGLLQVPSQKALWGGLLKIFTDFWEFWDPHWVPIWHHFPSKSGFWNRIKKRWFFVGRRQGANPPGGDD